MTMGQAPKLVFGTRGSDRIEASKEGGDRIFASDGDDRIVVREGSSLTDLHGGLGNDKFDVAGARTTAYGEGGDDHLSVRSAANRIYGNEGNDTLEVTGSDNEITGGVGEDKLNLLGSFNGVHMGAADDEVTLGGDSGGGEYNRLLLGTGSDRFSAWSERFAAVYGEDGDDELKAKNSYGLQLHGGAGNDRLTFSAGSGSELSGGLGNDRIRIDPQDDWGHGASTGNKIYGNQGDDEFLLGGWDQLFAGGSGNDRFYLDDFTTAARSTIRGDSGSDSIDAGYNRAGYYVTMDGGAGNDRLTVFGAGNTLLGGSGEDILSVGGFGDWWDNLLSGGQGEDRYIIDYDADSNRIREAGAAGESDTLQFDAWYIEPHRVSTEQRGTDLVFRYSKYGIDKSVTVERFFSGGGERIERFEFKDGTVWTDADVERMVQAMAGAPAAGAAGEVTAAAGGAQEILLAGSGSPGGWEA